VCVCVGVCARALARVSEDGTHVLKEAGRRTSAHLFCKYLSCLSGTKAQNLICRLYSHMQHLVNSRQRPLPSRPHISKGFIYNLEPSSALL
jgi:hypothetical protein